MNLACILDVYHNILDSSHAKNMTYFARTYWRSWRQSQVYSGSKEDAGDGEWVPVIPAPGALTINTGDMMQVRIWSDYHTYCMLSALLIYCSPCVTQISLITDVCALDLSSLLSVRVCVRAGVEQRAAEGAGAPGAAYRGAQ